MYPIRLADPAPEVVWTVRDLLAWHDRARRVVESLPACRNEFFDWVESAVESYEAGETPEDELFRLTSGDVALMAALERCPLERFGSGRPERPDAGKLIGLGAIAGAGLLVWLFS